ncbi:MAG: hypothetical protein ACHQ6T_16550 [Myxococcota bacterium]
MTAGKWMIAGALALALTPRIAAAEYWRYETDSGSTAFTDDAKNIPAKYRTSAVKIAEESLASYKRLSVVETTSAPKPRRLAADAVTEPVSPWPVGAAAQAPPRPSYPSDRISIDVDGVRVDVDADADEPITIDKRQYMDMNGEFFDHGGTMAATTIVRRGDKPLAYIDER